MARHSAGRSPHITLTVLVYGPLTGRMRHLQSRGIMCDFFKTRCATKQSSTFYMCANKNPIENANKPIICRSFFLSRSSGKMYKKKIVCGHVWFVLVNGPNEVYAFLTLCWGKRFSLPGISHKFRPTFSGNAELQGGLITSFKIVFLW